LILDTKTWKLDKEIKKVSFSSAARAVDRVAVLEKGSKGSAVKLLSMTDGSEQAAVSFEKGVRIATFGINADATRLAVFTQGVKDEAEPVDRKVPKGLRGAEAADWKQQHDGKTSKLFVYELPSGKQLAEHKLAYTTGDAHVFFQGDKVIAVNYSNVNARIDSEGKCEVFQLENSYNYGAGVSSDQKVILSGGLAKGSYTAIEGLAAKTFKVDKLPGWPEYFKGFAVATDGTGYAGTSAYRVIKVKPDGSVEKAAPIF
ncbi:MAG: YncE family protein, partial [Planctomycetota bacterium]|jgi:hypothetical protein